MVHSPLSSKTRIQSEYYSYRLATNPKRELAVAPCYIICDEVIIVCRVVLRPCQVVVVRFVSKQIHHLYDVTNRNSTAGQRTANKYGSSAASSRSNRSSARRTGGAIHLSFLTVYRFAFFIICLVGPH